MGERENPDDLCRINGLPDALLLHLLTFLPIKTAVRTSILSRRWRYLPTAIPSLNFDISDFPKKSTAVSSGTSRRPLDATDLFTVVPQFLLSHVSPLISFTLYVHLKNTSETRVLGGWIRHIFAVKQVKKFSLEATIGYDPRKRYELPLAPSDCGSVETLRLSCCVLGPRLQGMNVTTFPNLKTLSFSFINVRRSCLQTMLCSCPCLENLILNFCTGLSKDMKIISALRLQNLKIVSSDFQNLEVDAPCLLSFEFDCRSKSIDGEGCLKKLIILTRCVKVLKACGCALRALRKHDYVEDYPQFCELQTMVIRPCSMNRVPLGRDVVSLLWNTSPRRVHGLCVAQETAKISLNNPCKSSQQPLLQHLRSVSIYSFQGTQEDLNLVKNIVQGGVSLESVRITPAGWMDISRLSQRRNV